MMAQVMAMMLTFAYLSLSISTVLAGVPADAVVIDNDIVWDVANPDCFALSPKGDQVAYISRGAIWVSQTDEGPPVKLVDLPNTVTAILAQPKFSKERDNSSVSPQNSRYHYGLGPQYTSLDNVIGLSWESNQSSITYVVRKQIKDIGGAYHVMRTSLSGDTTEIALIEGNFGVPSEYTTSFNLSADGRFLVISAYHPLIWDISRSQPRATPFDVLKASREGDHYIGVEIDTRQLVLTDIDFKILKRFQVTFAETATVDLTWSPDEEFVVCRSRMEHSSYSATAFRVHLETGARTEAFQCNVRDRFVFIDETGRLLHLRIAASIVWGHFDGESGTRAAIIEADGTKRVLFTTSGFRGPQKGQRGGIFPPMVASTGGSFIAYAVPRPTDQLPGVHYHVVDLNGNVTPLLPVSDADFVTPFFPIAFTDQGRRLLARSGSTLFSISLEHQAGDGGN